MPGSNLTAATLRKLRTSVVSAVAKEKQRLLQERQSQFEKQRAHLQRQSSKRRSMSRTLPVEFDEQGVNPFKRRKTVTRTGADMWNVKAKPIRELAPSASDTSLSSSSSTSTLSASSPNPTSSTTTTNHAASLPLATASSPPLLPPPLLPPPLLPPPPPPPPPQFEFPPLQNGGTVEDIRERAATRLFEALRYHSSRMVNPNTDDGTDEADEDISEKLADQIEEGIYDLSSKDVMSTVYQQKCRTLVTNFKRNFDLILSVKNNTVQIIDLLQKSSHELATIDQKRMRAQVLEEAAKASVKLDNVAWLPSKREACLGCGEKSCEYTVLSSGTSHKDETWGSNNDEKTLWRCKNCGKRWVEQ